MPWQTRPQLGSFRITFLHLLLLAATAAGCAGDHAPSTEVPPAATARSVEARPAGTTVPGYNLEADEALGGHTIERHVGKSDEELAARLRREPGISAASTYTDPATAARVVADAVDRGRGRLQTWARRSGPRPNLVLTYRGRAGAVVGRSLQRGATSPRPCSNARVVIRWHDRAGRWIVLTSYPEIE